jgi:hypothetical protein
MIARLFTVAIVIFAFGSLVFHPKVQAEETTTNKIKDTTDDAVTNAKKTARNSARKMREATGTDNLSKDAQDKTNDVRDDVNNAAQKAERDRQ